MTKKVRWRWYFQIVFNDTGEIDKEVDLPSDGVLWADCVSSALNFDDATNNPAIYTKRGKPSIRRIDKLARQADGVALNTYVREGRSKSVKLFCRER